MVQSCKHMPPHYFIFDRVGMRGEKPIITGRNDNGSIAVEVLMFSPKLSFDVCGRKEGWSPWVGQMKWSDLKSKLNKKARRYLKVACSRVQCFAWNKQMTVQKILLYTLPFVSIQAWILKVLKMMWVFLNTKQKTSMLLNYAKLHQL